MEVFPFLEFPHKQLYVDDLAAIVERLYYEIVAEKYSPDARRAHHRCGNHFEMS